MKISGKIPVQGRTIHKFTQTNFGFGYFIVEAQTLSNLTGSNLSSVNF
jgi:hypothetical protein